jgi:hypothetical protein
VKYTVVESRTEVVAYEIDAARPWMSAGTDEPRDMQRDLDVPGHWAIIGPDSPGDGWSWTVVETATGSDADGGKVAGAREAMAAADGWRRGGADEG